MFTSRPIVIYDSCFKITVMEAIHIHILYVVIMFKFVLESGAITETKKTSDDELVPMLQVIDVDTTLFKKKMAAEKLKSVKNMPDDAKEHLKRLQKNFIEVEITSTEYKKSPVKLEIDEDIDLEKGSESQNSDDNGGEEYQPSNDDDSESSESENDGKVPQGCGSVPQGSGQGYIQGVSHPLDICVEKVKKNKFGSVEVDMEYDEKTKKYKCKRCGKDNFSGKSSINHHLRNICVTNPKFPCTYCPYKAKVAVSLRVHYARYHNTPETMIPSKTIPSTVGGKGKSKQNKKAKLINEQAAKKATIEIKERNPGKREGTSQKKDKQEEVKEKEFEYDDDTNTFTCRTCNMKIKTKAGVERHNKANCGEEKKKAHKCYFCPFTARGAARVRVHMGRKHGKWPQLDRNGVWIY